MLSPAVFCDVTLVAGPDGPLRLCRLREQHSGPCTWDVEYDDDNEEID